MGPPKELVASSASLVIQGANLYWLDPSDSTVKTAPLAGGKPSTLGAAQIYPYPFIAADAASVYFIDISKADLALDALPLAGGAYHAIAHGNSGPTGIASDGTHFYFSRTSSATMTGELVETTLATGAERVVTDGFAIGIARSGDEVFATSCTTDGVWSVPAAGGARTPLVSGRVCPFTIAVDATNVYFVDLGNGTTVPSLDLRAVPRAGGTDKSIGILSTIYFAVDGASAYGFADGYLVRFPLDGSPPVKLAPAPMGAGVAVDDKRVYFTQLFGSGATVLASVPK